jgi:hypothetical protein
MDLDDTAPESPLPMLPPQPDVHDFMVFPCPDVADHDDHELDAAMEPHCLPTLDPSQWLVLLVQKRKGARSTFATYYKQMHTNRYDTQNYG